MKRDRQLLLLRLPRLSTFRVSFEAVPRFSFPFFMLFRSLLPRILPLALLASGRAKLKDVPEAALKRRRFLLSAMAIPFKPRRVAEPQSRTENQKNPQLSDLIDHNIETIISLHMHAELKMSHHQRILTRMTAFLGRPAFFYLTLLLVAGWILFNVLGPQFRLPIVDPAPFYWLQGVVGLSALLTTILVLTTQNRQAKFAERRKHLDLQVNLIVEHKVSKLIALVEELRRDMPIVRDRFDQAAAAMSEAVDPQAVFLALDETLAEVDPDEEQMVIQSDFVMDVKTSIKSQGNHLSAAPE